MFRHVFLVKEGVFEEHSAPSKAVLDDSSITVDTASLDQRANKLHELHNSRIELGPGRTGLTKFVWLYQKS